MDKEERGRDRAASREGMGSSQALGGPGFPSSREKAWRLERAGYRWKHRLPLTR